MRLQMELMRTPCLLSVCTQSQGASLCKAPCPSICEACKFGCSSRRQPTHGLNLDSLSLLSAPCRGPHRSALHDLRVRAIPVSSTALPSELPLRLHAGAAADEGAIQRVAVLE